MSFRSSIVLLILLLYQFHSVQPGHAQPLLANGTAPDLNPCQFRGDDNTYGLGIRIGLYVQWITTDLAYNLLPEEASNIRAINSAFQLANLGGLLFITITKALYQPTPQLHAIECWIVLTFCLGGVCTGALKGSKKRGEPLTHDFSLHDMSSLGSVVNLTVNVVLVYYSIWFVFVGMDKMVHPLCNRYAFFFARVVSDPPSPGPSSSLI